MQYNVSFGSAFAVDQFGFVRKGTVSIESDSVVYTGNKNWSALAKLGVFLLITLLPLFLFGFGLGFLLALVVIHYFCASKGSIVIKKASISDIEQKGKQVKFKGEYSESGKIKKTVFNVDTEENAANLVAELKNK